MDNRYFEDEPINEGAKTELAKAIWSGASKVGGKVAKVPVKLFDKMWKKAPGAVLPGPVLQGQSPLRGVGKALKPDVGKILSIDSIKKNPKEAVKKLGSIQTWKDKGKTIKGELWDKQNKAGKIVTTAALGGAGVEEYRTGGGATKSVAKAGKDALNLAQETPRVLGNIGRLGTQAAAGLVSGANSMASGFNSAVEKGELLRSFSKEGIPTKIAGKVKDAITSAGSGVSKVASGVANSSTSSKVAAGVTGLAAAGVAAKLIKDALDKKDWYNNGCETIEDPEKRQECLSHVNTKLKEELQAKLKRCKYANNPAKCEEIISAKIKQLG